MLRYIIIFLVIALIASLLGFGNLSGTSLSIAWILLFVFLILFVISLITGRK